MEITGCFTDYRILLWRLPDVFVEINGCCCGDYPMLYRLPDVDVEIVAQFLRPFKSKGAFIITPLYTVTLKRICNFYQEGNVPIYS